MGIQRKVDGDGRVTIPKEIREAIPIQHKVEWFLDSSAGEIILKPVKEANEGQMVLPLKEEDNG